MMQVNTLVRRGSQSRGRANRTSLKRKDFGVESSRLGSRTAGHLNHPADRFRSHGQSAV